MHAKFLLPGNKKPETRRESGMVKVEEACQAGVIDLTDEVFHRTKRPPSFANLSVMGWPSIGGSINVQTLKANGCSPSLLTVLSPAEDLGGPNLYTEPLSVVTAIAPLPARGFFRRGFGIPSVEQTRPIAS